MVDNTRSSGIVKLFIVYRQEVMFMGRNWELSKPGEG